MFIDKNIKVHLACSDDDSRLALNYILYDGKYLIATNGHILAKIAMGSEKLDKEVYIHKDIFKAAQKNINAKTRAIELDIKNEGETISFIDKNKSLVTYTQKPLTQSFPDIDRILEPILKGKKQIKVHFNAKLLLDLVKALGANNNKYSNNVTLSFSENEDEPILVKSHYNPDNIGVLMPVRASD